MVLFSSTLYYGRKCTNDHSSGTSPQTDTKRHTSWTVSRSNWPIFGWKAIGFLSRHDLMALDRSSSCSRLLAQLVQLQLWQNSPLAKQSQYLQHSTHVTEAEYSTVFNVWYIIMILQHYIKTFVKYYQLKLYFKLHVMHPAKKQLMLNSGWSNKILGFWHGIIINVEKSSILPWHISHVLPSLRHQLLKVMSSYYW